MLVTYKKIKFIKYLYSHFPSRLRFGASTYYSFRRMIQRSQYLSENELKAYQLRQLKKNVQHAWANIPGYRKHWEENNFSPDKLKSLDDLKSIPFMTKEILRDKLEKFSYKKLKGLHKITTGGSTGIPFGFYQQRKNGLIELAFMHELWSQFYPKINLKTKATILRGKRMEGPIGYDPLNGLILSSFDLIPQNISQYIQAIEKYKTPILRAYPSSLYVFSTLIENLGLSIKHNFDSIMLGSEILYDFQNNQIQRIFKAPIVNWYGHGEKAVLAGYCRHNTKLHAFPQYGITEIAGQDGKEVQAGETGEIVGTSFWNYATPFIRYKTKDFARKGTENCSECNRHYQLIDEIQGREHEFIVDKNKKLIVLTGVSIVCGTFTEINQFRFYQDAVGTFIFRYVKTPEIKKVNTAFIQKSLFEKIGGNFDIIFQEVNEIERTASGKMMYLEQKLDIKKLLN
ncbi:Phenylacetate-coenzyme A ligase [subsurface metagenome]